MVIKPTPATCAERPTPAWKLTQRQTHARRRVLLKQCARGGARFCRSRQMPISAKARASASGAARRFYAAAVWRCNAGAAMLAGARRRGASRKACCHVYVLPPAPRPAQPVRVPSDKQRRPNRQQVYHAAFEPIVEDPRGSTRRHRSEQCSGGGTESIRGNRLAGRALRANAPCLT